MSGELEEIEELSLTEDKDEPSAVLRLAKNIRERVDDDDDDEDEDEEDDASESDDDKDGVKTNKRESPDSDADVSDDDDEDDDDADADDSEEEENNFQNKTTPSTLFPGLELSDNEEEEEEDENYLQKFDETKNSDIISQYYPELQSHNYDEVDAMARIVRDETGLIIDPLHKTLPFITKYEKARILGERAKQLNSGARPMVEIDETLIDGYLIALKEYDEKKIPFIIKRPMPNGSCEYWRFSDMEILV